MMTIQPYTVLKKETIIDEPHCHIEKHHVKFPYKGEGDWYVKIREDAVIVFPLLENGEVLLQRSYKHGSGQIVVECVAGLMDKGESAAGTARRELREETGYDSEHIQHVGSVFADPTGSTMKYHFYVAKNCVQWGPQSLDEAEQIEVFTVESIEAAKEYLSGHDVITSSSTRAMLSYV